jgi:hypothetical protein
VAGEPELFEFRTACTQGRGGECVMAISPARDDIMRDIAFISS